MVFSQGNDVQQIMGFESSLVRMLKILPFILSLGLFAAFAPGCGTDHAKVRFVHASPDADALDLAVDGKTVVTALGFGGISPDTGYLTVAAGNRRVEVRDTGTTTDQINTTVDFGSQQTYTLLATGKISDSSVAAVLKTDDNSAPASGKVKLRVIHVAPDSPNDGTLATCATAPCVDVYVVAPGTDITSLAPTVSSLSYQQASLYLTLTAATYEVIMTDSTNPIKNRLIDQTYDLTAGQIRTLVTLDTPDGSAISDTPLVLSDLN